MIQGGCPNGIGNGGPGYKIKCELNGGNQYHDRGVLSMAHAGRDTGGSQFLSAIAGQILRTSTETTLALEK